MSNFDSTYSAIKKLLENSGGDMMKEHDSSYSMIEELIEIAGSGSGTGSDRGFDFTLMGYSSSESESLNELIKSGYNEDIAYSKTLYDDWNPSNTSAANYFKDDTKLVYVPLLDTSNVANMGSMFRGCSSLTTIPLLDTSNVTNMYSMFNGCSSLTTIPLLDTSNVTDMSFMFRGCSSLTTIPLLDTSNVANMSNMFNGCSSLTTIPLLDTSNVTSMSSTFYGCSSLTNLGGFKDFKISVIAYFLDQSTKLTTESLMNVINNLYDLTANGLSGKTLKFGTTNLNKLTAEQIAVATNKGWTLT